MTGKRTILKTRKRGFGLIEIMFSIAVIFSTVGGSFVLLERSSDRTHMRDLTQSATIFSAMALQATENGRQAPQGDVSDFLGLRELPGMVPISDTETRHNWGGKVEALHYGGSVFRLSLDSLTVARCSEIVIELSTTINTPVGGVYPTVGDVYMEKNTSFRAEEMAQLCADKADEDGLVRAGWFFAASQEKVSRATGLTFYGGTTTTAPAPTQPKPEETTTTGGTDGEGTEVGEPEATPVEPGPSEPEPTPAEPEPDKTYAFNPSWSITGLDWLLEDRPQSGWGNKNIYEEWGVNIKSYWLPFPDALPGKKGMGFKIYGDGSPTMLDANGNYLDEGVLGAGTIIKMNTPPCGEKPVIYIEFDDGTIGSWDLQDQTWPNNWQPGKANCAKTTK